MTTTEKGRRRQQALFDFLARYPMATTDQLARVIWAGNQRLARSHLLRFTREEQLRRLPHPLFRNGSYVYTAGSRRGTTHSQKVLHHLAAVDFHLAMSRDLARHGARTISEMQWGSRLVPDQTVIWREKAWAVEHHLSGQFGHAGDYQRFMEEEQYTLCHWWKEGMRLGLLVITGGAGAVDHVVAQLQRQSPPGLTWRVGSRESVLRDPGRWLK